MPVVPEILALLEAQASDLLYERPGSNAISVLDARELHEQNARRFTPPQKRDAVANIQDLVLDTAAGTIPARLYRPASDSPVPTLVWFHGGGWVTGSLDTADIAARAMCARANVAVLSVDYRLAPEHPWPAGYEDCVAALQWAACRLPELGGLSTLIVGGDSAGGNLAAVVALNPSLAASIAAQVLLYPVVALDAHQDAFDSRVDNAKGYYVQWDDVAWALAQYIPAQEERSAPHATPIRSKNLGSAPPTIVATVEYDPLRDEGRALVKELCDDGATAVLLEFDGLVHGCFDMIGMSATADRAISEVALELRRLIGTVSAP